MFKYLLNRVLQGFLTLLIVSFLAFFMSHIAGNPADALLPADAGREEREILIREWGLDRPLHIQYGTFLRRALRGDLGQSLKWQGQTALGMVAQRLPATARLAGVAVVISAMIAIPVGVISAYKKGSAVDRFGKIIALFGQALAPFWLGIMLIWVFSVELGWFPTSGAGGWRHIVLPAITLGWYQVAAIMRLTRSAMLDALDSEYVKLARIKGMHEARVVWIHALRNAVVVPITYFGVIAGAILTRTVVVEMVFAWPGTGTLVMEAVLGRDFPVVQAVMITFALIFVVANLLVDIIYAYIDPRIRL